MKKRTINNKTQDWKLLAAILAIPVLLILFMIGRNFLGSVAPTPLPATPQPSPTATSTLLLAPAASPNGIPPEVTMRNGKYAAAPPMTLDPKKIYYAIFKTAQGDIKVQLFADRTPVTVNNFVFLAREGFYDHTTWHRVIKDLMAQGGDPTGLGGGGPGYTFADEFGPGLLFNRAGLLAMANAGPNTNGSQFFITFGPAPQFDGRNTIFGEVVEGLDNLNKLTLRDPSKQMDFLGDMLNQVVIEEATVSILPTATALPPTPTPFSPSQLDRSIRPLATLSATARSNYFNTPPTQTVIEAKLYTATMLTSQGVITFQLRGELAPIAVNNFVVLAELGFYDQTPVNHISDGNFMIFGAPADTPESDAGYAFKPEVNLPVPSQIGLLAYVPKSNDPSSASSSQLFISLGEPDPEAPARYSFFGQITSGIEVLQRLTTTDTVQLVEIEK